MINSVSNKQVRRAVQLAGKAKARREEGLFVAEGLRMCRECAPDRVEILYVTEEFASGEENRRWLSSYRYETVSEAVMKAMADTKTPQCVLGLVRQPVWSLSDILGRERPMILVLETIQDPGNLGTLLRAGEGAGITGLVMNRETADIFNPKVIRSTMGSLLRVPFVYVDDLKAACRKMQDMGIRLFAAHLKAVHNYEQADYTGSTGFLIGNEANGLSREITALADGLIKIPMAGRVESLNAAIAASVLMFEAARQRRACGEENA